MKTTKFRVLNGVLVAALLLSLAAFVQPAQAVSPNIVISQVYGGGGNSGGIYTNDFIELFNLGTTTVSLDGWSDHTVAVQANDNGGLTATAQTTVHVNNLAPTVAVPAVVPEPSTEGSSVTASATFSDPADSIDAPFTCTVNYGDGTGALPGTVGGNTCTGPAHTYPTFGSYTVTVSVTDKDGGTGQNTAMHAVSFNWLGFFKPVSNLPALNVVKAGSAIPVKFSLGGYKGLNIFATGHPVSTKINCATAATLGNNWPTVTSGSSGLSYSDQYNYAWKTDKAWAGTCRRLKVKLVDGTVHLANFMFQ
jgi:hypothetical protein